MALLRKCDHWAGGKSGRITTSKPIHCCMTIRQVFVFTNLSLLVQVLFLYPDLRTGLRGEWTGEKIHRPKVVHLVAERCRYNAIFLSCSLSTWWLRGVGRLQRSLLV